MKNKKKAYKSYKTTQKEKNWKKSEKIVKKVLTLPFLFDILTMQLRNNTQKKKNDLWKLSKTSTLRQLGLNNKTS